MSNDRGCCPIGRRADAAEIDAALRTGTPYRQVAIERGCPELASAIYRHRGHVGAVGYVTPEPRLEIEAAASEPSQPEVKQTLKQPEASEAAPTPTSAPAVKYTEAKPRAKQSARPLLLDTATPPEEQQRVTAERIRTIANLLAIGAWRGPKHVSGLAQRWGVPDAEVRRLHATAALRVKSDRGTLAAQRELSVALVSKMRDEELAAAAMYEKAAEEAFLQAANAPPGRMSTAPARLAKTLAGMSRTTALRAEEYLAKITFARPKDPTTLVNVSYSAHPDFALVAERLRLILETIAPAGTSARVDEALALWEQGGDAALEEWRREQIEASSLLLTQGDDGSYGAGEAVA